MLPLAAALTIVVLAGVAAAVALVRTPRVDSLEELQPTSTTLQIDSTPPGARIWVGGRDTGLTTPALLPGLGRGAPLQIELRLAGHQVDRQVLTPVAPSERYHAVLTSSLQPGGAAPAAVAAPAPAAENAGPPAPLAAAASERPPAVGASVARRGGQVRRPGYLSLRVLGAWADVYLGARKLGTTPLDRVEVPAGTLRLRLRNAAAAVDRELIVEVQSGAELKQTVTLSAP